ncbi:protein JINGUBANG [Sesamum alatum]|uniref:Protein JINGUBANG n=1 Tax=Sesamum alatum TaxID=300844 RepID=A0AAE1YY74_9LAMI|nr:protein JINGUBANG [Sesamum alatum]
MEEIQKWLANGYVNNPADILSKSPSLSSSATTSSTSQETHSARTLCEDTSFNSSCNNYTSNCPIQTRPSISHFCIATLRTLTPQISCLAVQNATLYAASIKEINVFDLNSFALVDAFGPGLGLVKSIAFSDGKIFTAHQDCKIRVWKQVISTSSGKQKHQLISTLPTFKDRLFNCMLAKNYVQVRRHKRQLWIQHADAVSGLAVVNNDAGLMYSVSWDKSFKIWQISSDMHCLESVDRAHSDAVNAIIVNPFDKTIYTGSADGYIKAWRKPDGRKKHQLLTAIAKHESSVNALAFMTRDGSILCSGGGDKRILVWETTGNDQNDKNNDDHMFVSCCLKGHGGPILCLVHVNGVVISGSSDRTVRIWKYYGKGFGGRCLRVLEGHSKPVKSLVGIPGGDLDDSLRVFSGSLDGEIRAWKLIISDETD